VTTITPVSPPPPDVPEHEPPAPGTTKAGRVRAGNSLLDGAILRAAIGESFVKLDPRTLMRNPVMFVVEVGSVLTTILWVRDLGSSSTQENVFGGLVALFLWFTVLFANFAEAVAEGRGKAQADTLRKTRSETMAKRRRPDGTLEEVPGTGLDLGDEVVVVAGEVIPSDGDVVEGIASIDESAIRAETKSRPLTYGMCASTIIRSGANPMTACSIRLVRMRLTATLQSARKRGS